MAIAELAILVRAPSSGGVKTRLAERLGVEGARALYEAFVSDVLSLGERVRDAGDVELALWATEVDDPIVSEWARRIDVSARRQPDGDLGARMATALEEGLRDHERVVLIGSDLPTLPFALAVRAFDALAHAPMAIGPAQDGGYYAFGATQMARPCFDRVRWSTRNALRDTLSVNAGAEVALLSPWYDVDEPDDLDILWAHLSTNPKAAPATARCLSRVDAAQR
jgi:rSAM/selenodomain-associated transferase 1